MVPYSIVLICFQGMNPMTGRSLFWERLKSEWRYQYRVFRSIADWTVAVYILFPFAGVGIYHYINWWNVPPVWFSIIPEFMLFLILYGFSWLGGVQVFLEEADQLYLLQKKKLVKSIKIWCISYAVIWNSAVSGAGFLIVLPLLKDRLPIYVLLLCFILFASIKVMAIALKWKMRDHHARWLAALYLIIIFNLAGTAVLAALKAETSLFTVAAIVETALFLLIAVLVFKNRIDALSSFSSDVLFNKKIRLRFVGLIFRFSEGVEKEGKGLSSLEKPIWFRKSKRVFKNRSPQNGVIELFIKVFMRRGQYLFTYLRLVGVTVLAILLVPPLWMKCGLLLGFIIILKLWLEVVYNKITGHSYLAFAGRLNEVKGHAGRKSVNLFLMPAALFMGAIVVLAAIF